MKAQIIQIGNSQGIRIPKVLLEDSRIKSEVDLELHPDGILIRNAQTTARQAGMSSLSRWPRMRKMSC